MKGTILIICVILAIPLLAVYYLLEHKTFHKIPHKVWRVLGILLVCAYTILVIKGITSDFSNEHIKSVTDQKNNLEANIEINKEFFSSYAYRELIKEGKTYKPDYLIYADNLLKIKHTFILFTGLVLLIAPIIVAKRNETIDEKEY